MKNQITDQTSKISFIVFSVGDLTTDNNKFADKPLIRVYNY